MNRKAHKKAIQLLLMFMIFAAASLCSYASGNFKPIDYSQRAKTYVVSQKQTDDCGIASIASMNAYFAKNIDGAYDQVWNANNKRPFIKHSSFPNYQFQGPSSGNITLQYLYSQLQRGAPCIVYGWNKKNESAWRSHYSVCVGYNGNTAYLEESGFQIMEVYKGSAGKITSMTDWLKSNGNLSFYNIVTLKSIPQEIPQVQEGWYQGDDGAWRWRNSDGTFHQGWKWIDNGHYYFKDDATMVHSTWAFIDDAWHYFQPSGHEVRGWYYINSYWYYFKDDGSMVHSTFYNIDGERYHFGTNGGMEYGWQKINNKWYFFDDNGKMIRNEWKEHKGDWYYCGEDGYRYTSTQKSIDGIRYSFDSYGRANEVKYTPPGQIGDAGVTKPISNNVEEIKPTQSDDSNKGNSSTVVNPVVEAEKESLPSDWDYSWNAKAAFYWEAQDVTFSDDQEWNKKFKKPSNLRIDNKSDWEDIRYGKQPVFKGTIKSNYILTEVTVSLERSDGSVYDEFTETDINSKSYSISKIKNKIDFKQLPIGQYILYVKAKDEKGSSGLFIADYFSIVP